MKNIVAGKCALYLSLHCIASQARILPGIVHPTYIIGQLKVRRVLYEEITLLYPSISINTIEHQIIAKNIFQYGTNVLKENALK